MTAKKREIHRKRSRSIEPKKSYSNIKVIIILLAIVIIIIVSTVFLIFGNNNKTDENPIAVISSNMGTIKVKLYQDKVPNTCENFINYVNDGFYDGLVFHRVLDNFVIQGGGFYPDGSQKDTNDPIDLEINEDLKHVDGAIAMARTANPDSATSQFFINDGAQSQLEPGGVDTYGYAVFGVVIEGMDVVRDIASVETTTKYNMQNWPVDDVIINSIKME